MDQQQRDAYAVLALNNLIEEYQSKGKLDGVLFDVDVMELAVSCIAAARNHSQFKHQRALEKERELFDAVRWAVAACLEEKPHIEIANYLKDFLK